ncbi:hypothetical protein AS850_03460 [Frondihabitans sp. 762G35]|uniref:hypothetical protein n=1 Tax=Frondihabitans sp. 762G35 TaxID=1446794 RepID=UPI000D211CB3|nr:hypothetical protein [Frondihabitans sp. 762G35]ARC56132.1 hypothetical protein AS850_03460 [Frondihabitans sp. 762G35]
MSGGSAARPSAGRRRDPRLRPALWSTAGVLPLPGPPYLEHVERLLTAHGRGPLPDGGGPSPDEAPPKPGQPLWMPGALEGILAVRVTPDDSSPTPPLAAAAIVRACEQPLGTISLHTVADRLADLSGPSDVDRLVRLVRVDSLAGRLRLAELARWLCRSGTRLRQVQSGIALLGSVGGPQDRTLVTTLGLLSVLTRQSVAALRGILPDAEAAVFELARRTSGWGRIHAVHGLQGTTTPRIQDWLLRGGYDSGVIDEELAGIAALSGDLAGALQGDVDDDLLHHAGRLLTALRWGGPAEDLADYPEGGVAIEFYLRSAAEAVPTIEILAVVQTLDRYLKDGAVRNPHLDATASRRLSWLTAELLSRPVWPGVAEGALACRDIDAFCLAVQPAARAGIDVRPAVLGRLEKDALEPFLWDRLLRRATPEQIALTVTLAERVLVGRRPDADVSPEAGESERLGECLVTILGRLHGRPGRGWPLVAAALGHPGVRVRRSALRLLHAWPADDRPASVRTLVERLRWTEADPELRALFAGL